MLQGGLRLTYESAVIYFTLHSLAKTHFLWYKEKSADSENGLWGVPKSQPEIMGQVVCTLAIKALDLFLRQLQALILCSPQAAFHRVIKKEKEWLVFKLPQLESSISLQPFQIKG